MPSIEHNNDDWKEIRARVDSIANAIFLISGGALTLSISVILNNKSHSFITDEVTALASGAWYSLLSSIILFIFLKFHLVIQAFLLQTQPEFVSKNINRLNGVGWVIGFVGLICFVYGLIEMVQAAVLAISV